MSDIIKDAKKALEGATPGPWKISGEFDPEYPELQGAPQLENGLLKVPIISHDIYGDFFPEDGDLIAKSWTNAKALAEETYEYIVQVKLADQWQFYIGESISPTDKPGLATGFSKLEYAREFAKIETKRPTRIVRRRVSPVEVVDD